MDVTVNAFPGSISIIAAIIYFVVLGLGIYLIFLLIKALRLYIKIILKIKLERIG